jgi:hypothetical protein
MKPVHTAPQYFFIIHCNIVPSMPITLKASSSLIYK